MLRLLKVLKRSKCNVRSRTIMQLLMIVQATAVSNHRGLNENFKWRNLWSSESHHSDVTSNSTWALRHPSLSHIICINACLLSLSSDLVSYDSNFAQELWQTVFLLVWEGNTDFLCLWGLRQTSHEHFETGLIVLKLLFFSWPAVSKNELLSFHEKSGRKCFIIHHTWYSYIVVAVAQRKRQSLTL